MSSAEKGPKEEPESPRSFEAALKRLEALVQELEGGDVPLEKSVQAYEEGRRLIQFCEKKLQAAETALKQLAKDAGDVLGKGERKE